MKLWLLISLLGLCITVVPNTAPAIWSPCFARPFFYCTKRMLESGDYSLNVYSPKVATFKIPLTVHHKPIVAPAIIRKYSYDFSMVSITEPKDLKLFARQAYIFYLKRMCLSLIATCLARHRWLVSQKYSWLQLGNTGSTLNQIFVVTLYQIGFFSIFELWPLFFPQVLWIGCHTMSSSNATTCSSLAPPPYLMAMPGSWPISCSSPWNNWWRR